MQLWVCGVRCSSKSTLFTTFFLTPLLPSKATHATRSQTMLNACLWISAFLQRIPGHAAMSFDPTGFWASFVALLRRCTANISFVASFL